MENDFASCLAPVLVKSRPFDDFWLERIVGLGDEFPSERLQDGRGIYAMREEVVK